MNKKQEIIVWIILIFSIFTQTTCSSDSQSPDNSPDPAKPPPITLASYNTIGIVTDLDGNSISFARVKDGTAGTDVLESSSQGVFFGDMGIAAGDWVEIRANGYAQNYLRSSGKVNDVQIVNAQLTPVGAWGQFESGNVSTVSHKNISAELKADLFDSDGTIVEVTEMLPQHMGASYALTTANEFRQLSVVFSITARDSDSIPVNLATAKSMPVSITLPDAVTNIPPLFYFDGDMGVWQVIAGVCSLTDSTHILCHLPHLSVFAVGGDPQPAALPYPSPGSSPESAANINHARALLEQAKANGSDTSEAEALLLTAVELDSIQASEYALANQNEKGKMRLMAAIAIRATINLSDGGLLSEVLNIAENIAQDFLDDDSCGKVEEMKAAMAQLETLDSDSGRYDKLEQKIATVKAACDPWIGKVNVSFYRSTVSFDGFVERYGSAWSEQHDITILIDPDSASGNPPVFMLNGEDNVLLRMSKAFYVNEWLGSCGLERIEMQLFSDPEVSIGTLNFTGTYDSSNGKFFINEFHTPFSKLMFSIWSYTYDSDCNPIEIPGIPIPYADGYGSIIGVLGIDYSPAITLQEMLNNGDKYSDDKREMVEGIRGVPILINPSVPWSVLNLMEVKWHFTHEKRASDKK